MNHTYPLISCVCITRNKPSMLKRAIDCFRVQTYPEKELIIIYEDDDDATGDFVTSFRHEVLERIRYICIATDPKQTLGALRNIGIDKASGTFICQWDDDDWYHMNRLMYQYNELIQNERNGSILSQWIIYDAVGKGAYISNQRRWEGSILCRKSMMQLKPYETKRIGEDTATIDYLAEGNHLHLINDFPGLYIYIYHGNNTWDYDHWHYIFKCSRRLSEEDSKNIAQILDGSCTMVAGAVMVDRILARFYAVE